MQNIEQAKEVLICISTAIFDKDEQIKTLNKQIAKWEKRIAYTSKTGDIISDCSKSPYEQAICSSKKDAPVITQHVRLDTLREGLSIALKFIERAEEQIERLLDCLNEDERGIVYDYFVNDETANSLRRVANVRNWSKSAIKSIINVALLKIANHKSLDSFGQFWTELDTLDTCNAKNGVL